MSEEKVCDRDNRERCDSCGSVIKPDSWDDVKDYQVKAETERPTATKENIKFCINPSASDGVKIPDENIDFGDKDFSLTFKVNRPDKPKTNYHGFEGKHYFGIEECDNGFVVRIGWKKYIVSTQAEAFEIRDKFRGWGLEGVNEYLKAKEESKDIKSKKVETFFYVVDKDGTPLRFVTFNKVLTVGEVNELAKQASGDRAFRFGGDPDKPFCDLL
ncbi:MAG: hypothetical protein ABII13_02985 [Patescibacteria group bacterium]